MKPLESVSVSELMLAEHHKVSVSNHQTTSDILQLPSSFSKTVLHPNTVKCIHVTKVSGSYIFE